MRCAARVGRNRSRIFCSIRIDSHPLTRYIDRSWNMTMNFIRPSNPVPGVNSPLSADVFQQSARHRIRWSKESLR